MEFIVGMWEGFFANPALEIWDDPIYFIQNVAGGLMVGILYSLVALGFVLIYKASGVFNFAQPMMAIFATLGLIFFHDKVLYPALGSGYGLTIVLALGCAMVLMVVLAILVERLILRPLVNQEEIILFMVTIGLYYFLEGFGETLFNPIANSPVPMEALGIEIGPVHVAGVMFQKVDMTAAGVSAVMVILLALMFQKTPVGRALRAVADDHQAAQSVGIPLSVMWIVVWVFAGGVALVAGVMWGASAGAVDFGMVFVGLKALPVLILGGFTSVPGVIIGGLIIGVGERIAEIYWSPYLGDSIESWFAYIIALIILFFRPEGLFGEKLIERI
ncbi:MAG: branched-chain amino acid ABC transporter permease [Methyloligellaceae bacterium]